MVDFLITICICQFLFILYIYEKSNNYKTISLLELEFFGDDWHKTNVKDIKTPSRILGIRNPDQIFWLSLKMIRIYKTFSIECNNDYTYERDKCLLLYNCIDDGPKIYYCKDITHWLVVDNDEKTINIIRDEYVEEFRKYHPNSDIAAFTGAYKLYDTSTLELYDKNKER